MAHASIGGSANPDPSRLRFEQLLEAFGQGWEGGKPAAMADVFAEDGRFVPGPFSSPVRGRTAIEAYWSDVPRDQAAISFRFGEIFVAGPWFASEFTCTFRRIKTGEWIQVSGAVFCETSGTAEKISEMRMYWDRAPVQAP
jgi:hypothetical protein